MSDRLFIGTGDDVHLPDEYHHIHNILVRLYDELVLILKDPLATKKFEVKLNFIDGDKRPAENEEDMIKWLEENGHVDTADELIVKQVFPAIISDACHFIYMALDSGKRMKPSVAFSLIRKPLMEHLVILEQLLIDEKEFLSRFKKEAKDFDPGAIKEDRKKELIAQCIKLFKGNLILKEDLIYTLRFDKTNPISFYSLSNQATHLVTTRHPAYKTSNYDMNFIFSGEEDWESQIQHFYYYTFYVSVYFLEVVDAYMLHKNIITAKKHKERKFYRFLCSTIWSDFLKDPDDDDTHLDAVFSVLETDCKNCNKKNTIYKSDVFYFLQNDYMLCKYCLSDLYYQPDAFKNIINSMTKVKID